MSGHAGAVQRDQDQDVGKIADEQRRVVASKDSDFRDGHLLGGRPQRLLVVRTGSIANRDLVPLGTAPV